MSPSLLAITLILCSFNLFLANPEVCQILNDPQCSASGKHACKSVPECDWSHHNFCYRKCADPETDYVYYPLNNNANDHSHFHLHGSAVGGQYVSDRFNHPQKALQDGYVMVPGIPTPAPLQFQNGFTVAAWIWFAQDQPLAYGWAPIVGNLEYTNLFSGYELWVTTWDNRLRTEFCFEWGFNDGGIIPVEDWVHVALTVSEPATGHITFYINGVVSGSDTRPYGVNDYSLTQFQIASQQVAGRQAFGKFDDIIAIDHAISAAELNTIKGVNAVSAKKAKPLEEHHCVTSACKEQAKQKAQEEQCKNSLCGEIVNRVNRKAN